MTPTQIVEAMEKKPHLARIVADSIGFLCDDDLSDKARQSTKETLVLVLGWLMTPEPATDLEEGATK